MEPLPLRPLHPWWPRPIFGTKDSAIHTLLFYHLFLATFPSLVIEKNIIVRFVSPVKQANMFAFHLVHLDPLVPFLSNCFIVICGLHHMQVFLVSNIILLFLMITHTLFGLFLYAINPTSTPYFSTFNDTFLFIFSYLSDYYNVIMVVNLTTLKIVISFFKTVFFFTSLVPIPLLKMARLNDLSALSTTLFVLF